MVFNFFIGFLEIGFLDILDIFLVGFLLYQVYVLVRGSVAVKILIGGLAVFMLYLLVGALQMKLLGAILGGIMEFGVIVVVVLFQQEIRKFLLVIGKASAFRNNTVFRNFFRKTGSYNEINVETFVEAAQEMAASLTGALVVFTKDTELKFYAESGDKIDAIASKRLIISIFNKYSPLHDGAMIIDRGGKVIAARCILPVSENDELPASLGLRHRSAIGLTEVSDAVVMVVSEETGQMSVVKNGKIYRGLSAKELKAKLEYYLTTEEYKSKETELVNSQKT